MSDEHPYRSFSHESSSENLDAIAADLAYERARAWARSPAGTPYGGTDAAAGARRGSGEVPKAEPSFKSPVCGSASNHPKDIEYGYCARCHDLAAKPKRP